MSGIGEGKGFCAACRVKWMWYGKPMLKDADCPKCGLPLIRTPRGKDIGAFSTENQRPKTRTIPPPEKEVTESG